MKKPLKIVIAVILALVLLIVVIAVVSNSKKDNESNNPSYEEEYYDDYGDAPADEGDSAEEVKNSELALSCQKIVCYGKDHDNLYELVAQVEESYSGSELQIGVIKNGEWVREFSSDFPWVDDDGTTYSWNLNGSNIDSLSCYYAGNGVFVKSYNLGLSYVKTDPMKEVRFFTGVSEEFSGYDIDTPYNNYAENLDGATQIEANDYQIISGSRVGLAYNMSYATFILDTRTMEYKTIKGSDSSSNTYSNSAIGHLCTQVYEDVFWSTFDLETGESTVTLYDKEGNKLFDTKSITSETSRISFLGKYKDGVCTVKTVLDSGSEYELTLDKKGNVLSQNKLDSEE